MPFCSVKSQKNAQLKNALHVSPHVCSAFTTYVHSISIELSTVVVFSEADSGVPMILAQ